MLCSAQQKIKLAQKAFGHAALGASWLYMENCGQKIT
jgi:hypothetical protein